MKARGGMRARCALLRARFAAIGAVLECGQVAKALGVHCAGHPDMKFRARWAAKAGKSLARAGWMGYPKSQAPFGEMTKRQQVKWIAEADAKVWPMLRAKRRKRKSALTKIAEQPPAKLPKLARKYHWQTA